MAAAAREAEIKRREKEVNERRLKLLYEAIDNDDPKGGVREADIVIKKFPNLEAAKCLKALCLIRLDRDNDAFAILDACDVDGQKHDELAVSAFIHCYKEASVPVRICQLYERIIVLERTEQNLVSYFMSYVRIKDFKRMQEVAQMLHKEFPLNGYWQWIVTTHALKAKYIEPGMAVFNWTMAERAIGFATHGRALTHPQVELLTMIKEGLGSYKEAAELWNAHREIIMSPPIFVEQRYIELLYKAGEYAQVIEQCAARLAANNDDWNSWKALFNATFELYASTEDEEKRKELLDKAVEKVLEYCTEEERNRGPFLARFELMTRYLKAALPIDERLGDPVEHLKAYAFKFFEKPCCYVDIDPYIPLIGENPSPFFASLRPWVQDKVRERQYRAVILFEKLRIRIGVGLIVPDEDRRGNIDMLITALGDIREDDHLAGGEVSFIAGSILALNYAHQLNPSTAMEMLCILENGANMFDTNYLSKVALCRMYGELKAVTRIAQLFLNLDIKSVQRETLGHLLFPMYEVCGMFQSLPAKFVQVTSLYNQAEREIGECMIGAFKNSTFVQLPGLLDLNKHMEKSALAAFSDVTHRYISAIFILDNDQALDVLHGEDIDWPNLIDNRDLELLPNFEQPMGKVGIAQQKAHSHREMVDITKMRHLLCRAVFTVGKPEKCNAAAMLEAAGLFKTHWEECKAYYQNISFNPVNLFYARFLQTASPLHFAEWIYGSCLMSIIRLLDAAHAIVAAREAGTAIAEIDADLLPTIEDLYVLLAANIPTVVQDPVLHMRIWIHLFSRAIQSLATCKLLLSFIGKRLGVTGAAAAAPVSKNKKKNKAKAQAQESAKVQPAILTRLQQLNDVISNTAAQYIGAIHEMERQILNPEYGLFPPEQDELYDDRVRAVLREYRGRVKEHILDSYCESMNEMMETLRRFSGGLTIPEPAAQS